MGYLSSAAEKVILHLFVKLHSYNLIDVLMPKSINFTKLVASTHARALELAVWYVRPAQGSRAQLCVCVCVCVCVSVSHLLRRAVAIQQVCQLTEAHRPL